MGILFIPKISTMECHGGLILTGETQRTRRKTCPNITLSIVNSTWTDLGANPESYVARVVQLNYQRFGRTSCLLIRTEMTGKLFLRGEFWEIRLSCIHACTPTHKLTIKSICAPGRTGFNLPQGYWDFSRFASSTSRPRTQPITLYVFISSC
jgi:hypothetical protein